MDNQIYDTAVIGAGAAGLTAAITAARTGAGVVLLEHMDQAAKKLPATGNGRCNYTNTDQKLENYYCDEPAFVQTVLAQFPYVDTIRFFEELGIRPVQKNGTCIYPESGQAASVRNALLYEVKRLHIPVILSAAVKKIQKTAVVDKSHRKEAVFEITAKKQTVYGRRCILATGGKTAKKTGSDGSGYIYARQLGHTVIEPLPALTALHADYKKWKLPAGVRVECAAALMVDNRQAAYEWGELQITDYGISGIVIFQFSRIAARALAMGQKVCVLLDFKPQMTKKQLSEYLYGRFHSVYHAQQSVFECLNGFLPDKLSKALLLRAQISDGSACAGCHKKQADKLAGLLKGWEAVITKTNPFDAAQVTTGGVPVREICASSMESRLVPGLYFAGEIIDVDAKCGGYNLQWAWSSGYAAGKAAGIDSSSG